MDIPEHSRRSAFALWKTLGVPTVHLLCGLPASGKTTLARRLEQERVAVRFTLDEWMLSVFDLAPSDAAYGPRASRVKELIWRMVERVLALGHDVVLDWSHWSVGAREEARRRAAALGADAVVHYIDVPLEVVEQRLAERNMTAPAGVHLLDLDDVRRFARDLFEPPTPAEAVAIVVESPD